MRRIVVKGVSGAGKTTLASELARRLDVPHVELDALHHGPNWQAATPAELCARIEATLDDARGWVVDGNYDSKIGTLVLDRAELVVWLDLPLRVKLARLLARTYRRVRDREVLWNGNRETFRGVFWGSDALVVWALRTHVRHRRTWPRSFENRRVIRLRTPEEVTRFLEEFRG